MKRTNPTRITYKESFALDLNRVETAQCSGIVAIDGRIKALPGFTDLFPIKNYLGFADVTDDGIFLYTRNKLFLYDGSGSPALVHQLLRPINDINAVVHRNTLYTSYDTMGFWKSTHDKSVTIGLEGFDDVTVSNERIVGLKNGNRVWIGEAGDDEMCADEEKAVYVDLPTKCQAIQALGDKTVYALGDVCYKLSLSADLQKVTVEAVAQGLGTAYRDTALALNYSIVFAAKGGIYRIKNDKATRLFPNLGKNAVDFAKSKARVAEGKVILITPLGNVRRAYVLDVDKQCCIAVLDGKIADVAYWQGKLYVVGDDMLFKSAGDACANATFTRAGIDFGNGYVKHLRRVTLTTSSDVYLTINNGKHTVTRRIKGSSVPQQIPVNACGRAFDIQITSAFGAMDVRDLLIEADIYKEEK